MKQNRRQSRENAFLLLFEWSFHAEPIEAMIQNAEDGREAELDVFARELVEKTVAGVSELDALIERYSESWKLTRLSRVTLAILRMALCEITLMSDIPLGATVNEAVELSKRYGTEDEAAYINGILGHYGRDRKSGPLPEPETEPEVEPEAELE